MELLIKDGDEVETGDYRGYDGQYPGDLTMERTV